MKMYLFASLTLVLCLADAIAQDSAGQTQPRRLTYEQVLARWDRSRAYGDPRDLRQFSGDMVSRLKTGDETDDFSEGLRDGPWIRFYARSEQIFGGATNGVLIISTLAIVFGLYRLVLAPFKRILTTAARDRVQEVSPTNDRSGISGVRGWLLFLCLWLTIIGPFFSFAKLHELPESQMGVGILLILSSIATGALLWTGRYIGYRAAVIFFGAMMLLSCLALLMRPSEETITQAVATAVTSGLWLAYLGFSQRVKNTYFRETVRSRSPEVSTSASAMDLDEMLRKLAKLKDDGLLTQEEFDAKKRELLRL